jgi:hypothetical protein
MSDPVVIGPWPLGINDRQAAHALPEGTLHDAVNVDLDNLGFARRRPGYAKDSSAMYFADASGPLFEFDHYARHYLVERDNATVLLFSDPFTAEVVASAAVVTDVRQAFNAIPFKTAIKVCVPVKTGIWVATETETWFLAGKDAATFEPMLRLDYGGLYDSGRKLATGEAIWTSTQGVMVGDEGGNAKNLTYAHIKPRAGSTVAALVVTRDGITQYLTSLAP